VPYGTVRAASIRGRKLLQSRLYAHAVHMGIVVKRDQFFESHAILHPAKRAPVTTPAHNKNIAERRPMRTASSAKRI